MAQWFYTCSGVCRKFHYTLTTCACNFNVLQIGRRRTRDDNEEERDRRRHSSPGRGRDWSPPPHKRMRREPWCMNMCDDIQYMCQAVNCIPFQ